MIYWELGGCRVLKTVPRNTVYLVVGARFGTFSSWKDSRTLEFREEDIPMWNVSCIIRLLAKPSKVCWWDPFRLEEMSRRTHNVMGKNQRENLAPIDGIAEVSHDVHPQPLPETSRVSRTMFLNGFRHLFQSLTPCCTSGYQQGLEGECFPLEGLNSCSHTIGIWLREKSMDFKGIPVRKEGWRWRLWIWFLDRSKLSQRCQISEITIF